MKPTRAAFAGGSKADSLPSHLLSLDYYTRSCNSGIMPKAKCQCPPKPTLAGRPLLSVRQGAALESTFKTLANGTRLRLLHALARSSQMCVGELAEALKMKPQAVSNQLQRLTDRGIVESRREGLQIYYSIIDPCVLTLLDQGWCLAEDAKTRTFDRVESAAS